MADYEPECGNQVSLTNECGVRRFTHPEHGRSTRARPLAVGSPAEAVAVPQRWASPPPASAAEVSAADPPSGRQPSVHLRP